MKAIENCYPDDLKIFSAEITDNGIGIPFEKQDMILSSAKTDNSSLNFDGTGIGLTICLKLSKSLNGIITFYSERVLNQK
mmetsp:Transcript_10702/g.23576  ORF Transcript_10702/g.23576 Transcript_10702/m.23576 type:complete len:80 (+) Transcript_10702:615-854(+)